MDLFTAMNRKYQYKLYGLTIDSVLECPELIPGNGEQPDVKINLGEVPRTIPNIRKKGAMFQASSDEFLFFRQNIAWYHIRHGNEIIVEPQPNADPDEVKLCLLNSPFGALLHQRGYLVLHGSTIQIVEGCIAFLGKSGAGKSTLAATFHKHGYSVVTDDVCAILSDKQNMHPIVQPEGRYGKIWADTLVALGEDESEQKPLLSDMGKYYFEYRNVCSGPLPLKRIYVLTIGNEQRIFLNHLTQFEKISALIRNTYRFKFAKGLNIEKEHFNNCVRIANKVPIVQITRPSQPFLLEELFERILNDAF